MITLLERNYQGYHVRILVKPEEVSTFTKQISKFNDHFIFEVNLFESIDDENKEKYGKKFDVHFIINDDKKIKKYIHKSAISLPELQFTCYVLSRDEKTKPF